MKVPVLIPRIFDHPHTYLSGKLGKLEPGSIVVVPFGRENELFTWEKTDMVENLKSTLKEREI